MPPLVLQVKDCRAAYEALSAKGVEFIQEPIRRYGQVDAGFRDPSGNGWKMIERQRLVLVAHIDAYYLDAFAHGASSVGAATLVAPARRRFSRTAIFRSGRSTARTTHSGMPPRVSRA